MLARVRAALKACDFVVVSDVTRTDTTRYADVLLPAAGWGEKDGTVTNSERRLSRQRPFVPVPGEARPDWRIICDVAARMGFSRGVRLRMTRPRSFASMRRCPASRIEGERCSTSAGWRRSSDAAYEDFRPRHWPSAGRSSAGCETVWRRAFSDARRARPLRAGPPGGHRLDRRCRLSARAQHRPFARPVAHHDPHRQRAAADGQHARAARSTSIPPTRRRNKLTGRRSRPPLDALWLGPRKGPHHTERSGRGQAFLPMHWSGNFAANAGAGPLMRRSPIRFSGQPELKHVPVRIVRESDRPGRAC